MKDFDFKKFLTENRLTPRSEVAAKLREGAQGGGKVLNEKDFVSGGYVEVMGPDFDKACNALVKAFKQWTKAPLTEPGMIPHAKAEVLAYIKNSLNETGGEVEEEGTAGRMGSEDSNIDEVSTEGKYILIDRYDGTATNLAQEEIEGATEGLDENTDGDYSTWDGEEHIVLKVS